MPQALIYLERDEDKKIIKYSVKWKLSKADTIKRIIKEFEESENGYLMEKEDAL